WVTAITSKLSQLGYDGTTYLDWAADSRKPEPGLAILAGLNLASKIESTAESLVALQGLNSNDVIDLHLIGHSRGTVVISQALLDLQGSSVSQLAGGYVKMTMLDPHPALNYGPLPLGLAEVLSPANVNGVSTIGQFSFNPDLLSRIVIA